MGGCKKLVYNYYFFYLSILSAIVVVAIFVWREKESSSITSMDYNSIFQKLANILNGHNSINFSWNQLKLFT